MMIVRSGQKTTVSPRWLLMVMAPALVIGIIAMHSLLVQSSPEAHTMPGRDAAAATSQSGHAPVAANAVTVPERGDDGGHGTEGGMSDCSGLMAICLALLVSFAGLAFWARGRLDLVLWQRPRATLIRLGTIRAAFETLTTLQRTTVLRC